MEIGKAIARRELESLGFKVDDIDVGDGRTADLRVTGESVYHVEAKDKLESEEQAEDRRETLARGELYEQFDPLAYNNRIRGILRDARDQLNATPKAPGTFQLIWFHATGIDADTRFEQAVATFYGYVHLSPRYPHQHLPSRECFYFDYNAAFDMPDIEALILTTKAKLQVSVNEFATRADEFRSSDLYRAFADRGGICDPTTLESAGIIVTCRFDGPRNDEAATVQALQKQTGILYTPQRLNRWSGCV
jgi:hypothetical protein